jgi:hypothetical protein
MRDRRRVGRHVGHDLDLGAVGTEDVRQPAVVAGGGERNFLSGLRLAALCQLIPVRDHLRRQCRHIGGSEADVIECRAVGGSGRLSLVEEQEDVGELDHLVLPELHRCPAERIDPELLVLGNAGDVEVIVADDDRRFFVEELRRRARRGQRDEQSQDERDTSSIHGDLYGRIL